MSERNQGDAHVRTRLERVLAMVREGKVTEEQGAELIRLILAREEKAESARDRDDERAPRGGRSERVRQRSRERLARSIGRTVERSIRRGLAKGGGVEDLGDLAANVTSMVTDQIANAGGASAWIGQFADIAGKVEWEHPSNRVVMSSPAAIEGSDYTCEENQINVSSLSSVRIRGGRFRGNRINASGVHRVEIETGGIVDCAFRASSLTDTSLREGEISACEFNGAKARNLEIVGGTLSDCHLASTNLRDVRLDHSSVSGGRFTAATLRDLAIRDESRIEALTVHASTLRDVTLTRSRIHDLQVRLAHLLEWNLVDTTLSRCRIDGASGRMHEVRFENMAMEDCEFIDCRFSDVTFSGFSVKGLVMRRLNLRHKTVTSREELDKLIEVSRSATRGDKHDQHHE